MYGSVYGTNIKKAFFKESLLHVFFSRSYLYSFVFIILISLNSFIEKSKISIIITSCSD